MVNDDATREMTDTVRTRLSRNAWRLIRNAKESMHAVHRTSRAYHAPVYLSDPTTCARPFESMRRSETSRSRADHSMSHSG